MKKDDIKKQKLEVVKEQDLENVNGGVAVASSGDVSLLDKSQSAERNGTSGN